jgi:hypothetical protein
VIVIKDIYGGKLVLYGHDGHMDVLDCRLGRTKLVREPGEGSGEWGLS